MAEAIYQVNGASYSNEKSIGLYPTTGAADDWMYSDDANEGNGEYRAGVYTIELRDTGFYGFQLPPEYVSLQIGIGELEGLETRLVGVSK